MRVLLQYDQLEVFPESLLSANVRSEAKDLILRHQDVILDLNEQDYFGWPRLLTSASNDRSIENLKVLASHHCNFNVTIQDCPLADYNGFSIVHLHIDDGFSRPSVHGAREWEIRLNFLIQQNIDLQAVSHDGDTPTSLALRHPWTFILWRKALFAVDHFDLESFCRQETSPPNKLTEDGWTERSLRQIFELSITPVKAMYPEGRVMHSWLYVSSLDFHGYCSWWQAQLRSCNSGTRLISYDSLTPFCRSSNISLSSSSSHDIILTRSWGIGLKNRTWSTFSKRLNPQTCRIYIQRFDILIWIWPDAHNDPKPYTKRGDFAKGSARFCVLFLRRREWWMIILVRMS